MSRRAFTLMELLFVIVIVGILVAIALPGFGKTTERAQQRQTWDMLQTIYAGEQVFFSINNRFCDPTASATFGPAGTTCDRTAASGATWGLLLVDNPTTATTTYTFSSVITGPPATFTATATRNGGQCAGRTMTIDQRGRNFMGGLWLTCPVGGL